MSSETRKVERPGPAGVGTLRGLKNGVRVSYYGKEERDDVEGVGARKDK